MKYVSRSNLRWIGAVPAIGLLAGCASIGQPPQPSGTGAAAVTTPRPPGAAASGAAPGTPVVAATPPGAPRPFADVIKDAKRTDGLFATWQKDEKFWLELKPEDFDRPFILSPKLKTGFGEGRFFGGLMADELVFEFRRVHNLVQMLSRNTEFTAKAGTPAARAVEAGFSPSLLASTAVVSQPHPERKTVLIEANPLFVNDMLGYGMFLQRAYRQGYALDGRNSAITTVRSTSDLVVIEALNHYATANIALPTPGMPPQPGAPVPSAPKSVPDPRSLFITMHYSLAKLPEQPMRPRKADARVGYFTSNIADFTDDLARTPRERHVIRWRLEKKDPAAALSEPVKPITFWLDRNIPVKYRAAMTAGVLEWNKAFEKIGFKGAVRVEQQPDDATWDTLDFGRASIRWMTNATPSFGAIGPSHVDPRSGEILDADIGFESLSSRNLRNFRSQIIGAPMASDGKPDFGAPSLRASRAFAACEHADAGAEQLAYAFDVLEARGELDPNGPEAEAFVNAYLKDTTMHEVGHTLGLRHNFRSSRIYSDAQVSDPVFTAANAMTGSVMEYAPINLSPLSLPEARRPSPFNTTLGPYDYWAVEYAYKPIAPEQEAAELARIAGRSAEPLLAYGTDEDNYLGVDPESLHFDLGSDVMAYARKRVAIARDLIARLEQRQIEPGQDYGSLRRSVQFALRDMSRTANAVVRQIGGVRTLRDHAGTGRDPLTPVPATVQREALDVLTRGFLAADSIRLSPALQRRLAIDYNERTDAIFRGEMPANTDFSAANAVLELQRGLLNQLMSEQVASRLLDSEAKAPREALKLRELVQRLGQAVWSELGGNVGTIDAQRRELQREHVNRLASMLVRPSSLTRADSRGLMRAEAQDLLGRIEAAARRAPAGSEVRAHLADSADTLAQALASKPQRAGV